MHALRSKASSGLGWMLSGLQHHLHRREQPFRKTFVRIPGPSFVQKCWMFRTVPVTVAGRSEVVLMVSSCLVAEGDAEGARGLHHVAGRRHGPDAAERLAQRDALDLGWSEH